MLYESNLNLLTNTYIDKVNNYRYVFTFDNVNVTVNKAKHHVSIGEHILDLSILSKVTQTIVEDYDDSPNDDNGAAYYVIHKKKYISDNYDSKIYVGFPIYWESAQNYEQAAKYTNQMIGIIPSFQFKTDNDLLSYRKDVSIHIKDHLREYCPHEYINMILYYIKYYILNNSPYTHETHASGGYCTIPEEKHSRIIFGYTLYAKGGKPVSISVEDLSLSDVIFI
jgi:hypothetical protein